MDTLRYSKSLRYYNYLLSLTDQQKNDFDIMYKIINTNIEYTSFVGEKLKKDKKYLDFIKQINTIH